MFGPPGSARRRRTGSRWSPGICRLTREVACGGAHGTGLGKSRKIQILDGDGDVIQILDGDV